MKFLKTLISNIRTQLYIMRRSYYRKNHPALNDLDRKLNKYLNYRNGYFIEVGANDGYTQSNTYYLENKLGWKGILIEGIPESYEKCKKLRRNSHVYNYALVSHDYLSPTIKMNYVNLMSFVEGSFKTDQEKQRQITEGVNIAQLDKVYSIEVPTQTLESIIEMTPGRQKIDFLSLDVEGYELEVLKGMNITKYRPTYILVEARYFDDVNSFLERNNYKFLMNLSFHDSLYRTNNEPN